jgi:hypothetical protein
MHSVTGNAALTHMPTSSSLMHAQTSAMRRTAYHPSNHLSNLQQRPDGDRGSRCRHAHCQRKSQQQPHARTKRRHVFRPVHHPFTCSICLSATCTQRCPNALTLPCMLHHLPSKQPMNAADPGAFVKTTTAPSRGALTTDFLTGSMSPLEYLQVSRTALSFPMLAVFMLCWLACPACHAVCLKCCLTACCTCAGQPGKGSVPSAFITHVREFLVPAVPRCAAPCCAVLCSRWT